MVHNNISNLRKELGLNQKELGEKLNVGQTTVSAWETGRSEPDNETLAKLSKMFRVSIGYLTGYEKSRKRIRLSEEEEIEMEEQRRSEPPQETLDYLEEEEAYFLHEDFLKNGKGLFFEAFHINKACEYMSETQRKRALNILKAAFPNAFNSSYNPD